MAQDLERARKEDVLPDSAIKSPTVPPPPPPVSPIIPTRKIVTAPTIISTPSIISQIPSAPIAPAIPTKPIEPAMPTLKREVSPEPPFTPKAAVPALKPSPMPIPPTAPIARPEIAFPPIKKSSRLSFPQLNLIIGILAVVIILSGSIGFSYWWFFVRETPIEPVAEEPIEPITEEKPAEPVAEKPIEIPEPTAPSNIVIVDSDIVIEIDNKIASPETLSSLIPKISLSSREILKDKNLGRILIKYSAETEKSYLTFQETIDLLQIKIPNTLLQNSQNGEILTYSQNGIIRYGFAIKITGDSLSALDYMNSWEKTIIDDIKNLYIENLPIITEDSIFKDNFYESFVKSYINLPDTETSLDWAVSNEKKILIIATSKDMAYKIMDAISSANLLP